MFGKDGSGSDSGWISTVSGPVGLGLGMISHPRFLGSVLCLVSSLVSGLVFHPWISNEYPK
jgi:hypothetical protein